jgi:hypothetical protein
MSDIKLIRLINTEQIIGTIIHQDEDFVTLEFPLELFINYSEETEEHSLYLTKWSPFSPDTTLTIPKYVILNTQIPRIELLEYYTKKINKVYLNINNETNLLNSYSDDEFDTEH